MAALTHGDCKGTHIWQQDLGQEAVLVRLDLQDQSGLVIRILSQLRRAPLAYNVLAHHFVADSNEPLIKPTGAHRGRQAWHRHESVRREAAAQSTPLRATGPQQQRSSGQCVERAMHRRDGMAAATQNRARLTFHGLVLLALLARLERKSLLGDDH